jgi:multiple sugar transport system ATP-binding protein
VAMGRALAREPQLFLFDEPLSNLDAKLRVEMRSEIKLLHKRLGITTVYVTHDQIEAMTLGDKIAVMKDGIVQQFGTPEEIYESPTNTFVAGFMGSPPMNLIPIELVANDGGLVARVTVGNDSETVDIRLDQARPEFANHVGKNVLLGLRPEHLSDAVRDGVATRIEIPVAMTEMTGADTLVFTRLGGTNVVCRLHPRAVPPRTGGSRLGVQIDLTHAVLFERETGLRLDA